MKRFSKMLALLFLLPSSLIAQHATQIIKGKIIDESSQEPLPFVSISILDTDPLIGTVSEMDGSFVIEGVPVGRYDLEVSCLGYDPIIESEVIVTLAKEVTLEIKLKESVQTIGELIVKPELLKEKPLNNMALIGARMLSVEEASRYAGGFDDPARLASSFAGVSSSLGNNAIVVRGNAPKFLQWKVEGVEIPNPNHFANLGAFGGGGLTALSSNLLANSDFYTGAFTAEYNNAISGVFDIQMRHGNSGNFEHSVEIGAIGIDLTSEGPISKKSGASYLFNYRYSTLGLVSIFLPEDAQGTTYQDLSFKFKFPTEKAGVFSLWGIGLIDRSGTSVEEDAEKRHYYQDKEEQDAKQFMGAAGLNHRLILKKSAYLNSTLAFSSNGINLYTDRLDANNNLANENEIHNTHYNLTFKSVLNKKFNARHTNRTGITLRGFKYDLLLKQNTGGTDLETIVDEDGITGLGSIYSNSLISLARVQMNLGVNAQVFALNGNYTIEPRFALAYQPHDRHKISFGYGMHSRLEALNIYFSKTPNASLTQANKDLGFSKAHHFMLSYDWNITPKLHLKLEPYFQFLYNIPVIRDSSFSLLNLQNNWFVNDAYENLGKGQNYGLDFTLEHYMEHGFYFMVTASIFNSQYKTNQDTWYSTRFNKNYLVNLLVGKEFKLGKLKQSLLGLNLRFSVQGGDRYSRIDQAASDWAQDVVYNEVSPFTERTKPAFVSHATITYDWSPKKVSHRLALKVLNATNFQEFQGHRYNLTENRVEELRESLIIPNISYRLSF